MSSSDEGQVNKYEQTSPQNDDNDVRHPTLRYRRRTIYLLLFYVPLLIIPWILTCIVAGRPALNGVDASQYLPRTDSLANGAVSILGLVTAIRTLNSIASVATIPVISALLAQAAVVYTQRRNSSQSLSLRQTFVLADRRWADVTVLFEAARTAGTGMGSPFLWWGICLVAISAVLHPVQQLLVSWQSVPVMTCADDPTQSCGHPPTVIGYDPEPADLATTRQNRIVQEVMSSLVTFNDNDFETHLWPDPSYISNRKDTLIADPSYRQMIQYWTDPEIGIGPNFFVTALQNGTVTGVLREHAMRLNSSIQCEQVSQEKFPSTCPGRRPFSTSFSNDLLDIRVCAPGEYGIFPWTLSRNRQDITEQLFLDAEDRRDAAAYPAANFTLHCKSSTTRGYFELGNSRNQQAYGPLLEEWPGPDEMARDFNDNLNQYAGVGYGPPTEWDETEAYHDRILGSWTREPADPFGTASLNMSGPLMTSAIALFGNQSFFYVASNSSNRTFPPAAEQICQQGRIPFSNLGFTKFNDFQQSCTLIGTIPGGLSRSDPDLALATLLGYWIYGFDDTDAAEEALTASMYITNRAMLTQTVQASFAFSAREIWYGAGTLVPLPGKTVAGTAIISILILLQLLGLSYLTKYIYGLPTWSHALNAISVAQVGASLRPSDLPEIGQVTEKDEAKLTKISGWVGLLEEEDNSGTRLGVGAPGLIKRKHASKTKKKKGKKGRNGVLSAV